MGRWGCGGKSVLPQSLGARYLHPRLLTEQLVPTFLGLTWRFGDNMLVSKTLNMHLSFDQAIPVQKIYLQRIIKDVLQNLATEGTL